MTDSFHKSGFKNQAEILFSLITVVEIGLVSENLFSNGDSNKNMVLKYIIDLNAKTFTHLHRTQIETFALSLFNKVYSYSDFKSSVRDFLVNLKSFSGNHDELFEEEKNIQIQEARAIEEKKRLNIPGLLPVYNETEFKKMDASNYNYNFDQ